MHITLTRDVKKPNRGTSNSAGIDFYVPNDFKATILEPGQSVKIPSGVKMLLPPGKVGIFFNKSGHGSKGLQVGACVVDSDYRGEVHLDLHNISLKDFEIKPGMKITQMLVQDVDLYEVQQISNEEYSTYENTERGSGGFGSTGDK